MEFGSGIFPQKISLFDVHQYTCAVLAWPMDARVNYVLYNSAQFQSISPQHHETQLISSDMFAMSSLLFFQFL